jgi:hypothetical protein
MKLGSAHGANWPVVVSDKVGRSHLEHLVDKPLSLGGKAGDERIVLSGTERLQPEDAGCTLAAAFLAVFRWTRPIICLHGGQERDDLCIRLRQAALYAGSVEILKEAHPRGFFFLGIVVVSRIPL